MTAASMMAACAAMAKERGIAPESLAPRAGLSKTAASRWMAGANEPSFANACAMLDAAGLMLSLGGEPAGPGTGGTGSGSLYLKALKAASLRAARRPDMLRRGAERAGVSVARADYWLMDAARPKASAMIAFLSGMGLDPAIEAKPAHAKEWERAKKHVDLESTMTI